MRCRPSGATALPGGRQRERDGRQGIRAVEVGQLPQGASLTRSLECWSIATATNPIHPYSFACQQSACMASVSVQPHRSGSIHAPGDPEHSASSLCLITIGPPRSQAPQRSSRPMATPPQTARVSASGVSVESQSAVRHAVTLTDGRSRRSHESCGMRPECGHVRLTHQIQNRVGWRARSVTKEMSPAGRYGLRQRQTA